MNLDTPEDRDLAAGEYVTGTLDAIERTTFENALADDPTLQKAVYDWQDRLLPLARRAPPMSLSRDLWTGIEARLDLPAAGPTTSARAANDSIWDRVTTWRAATGLALAASLVLAVLLALRGPVVTAVDAERYIAVLQSPGSEKSTGWLVEATPGRGVRLVPVGSPAAPPAGKSLQFWTKPRGAAGPTSLGLIRAGEVAVVPIERLPAVGDRQLFEVTLEPEGGSTIGRPTGPILYVGTSVHL